jgi:plastocyanin
MTRYTLRAPVALGALLVAALLGAACGGGEAPPAEAPAPASTAAAPAGGSGSIAGVVSYANGDPDTAIKMDADPVCLGLHTEPVTTQAIVTDGQGNLGNVLVYVKSGLPAGASWPAPAEAAVLDQKGCQYHPHVQGVQVGQKVSIVNSDPTLHNIHSHPSANQEFNQGQPFQGMTLDKVFDKVEVAIPFRCDVHPWMASYIAVLDHPYFAVSSEDGSFAIEGLPAGAYTLEAWHETLGTQTQEVTVAEGQPAAANFSFAGGA